MKSSKEVFSEVLVTVRQRAGEETVRRCGNQICQFRGFVVEAIEEGVTETGDYISFEMHNGLMCDDVTNCYFADKPEEVEKIGCEALIDINRGLDIGFCVDEDLLAGMPENN